MIKIIFKELPTSKEIDIDFESISAISNNSSFNPGIKSMGGNRNEYIDQSIELQFEDDNIEALFISGETANYVKKVIKKSL